MILDLIDTIYDQPNVSLTNQEIALKVAQIVSEDAFFNPRNDDFSSRAASKLSIKKSQLHSRLGRSPDITVTVSAKSYLGSNNHQRTKSKI